MRIYTSAYELISEIFREVWEMGHIVHPMSMQNKDISLDEDYSTKEITNYSYALTNLHHADYLFFSDPRARKWADAEFEERVDPNFINPGKAWEFRKHIWTEFLDEFGEFDYTYNDRVSYSIGDVIGELTRNPDSRQAIISIWDSKIDPIHIGGVKRVPCSMYYQILIRNGKVNIIYNQRSADVVTHFGNDVYLAWQMMKHIAGELNLPVGHLFHNIGSLHSYKKDWKTLKRCIDDIQAGQ